jgi:hypothetical protein
MGKQKNHGIYLLREWSGFFANPLAIKLADVFSKTPLSRQAGRAPFFSGCQFLAIFDLAQGAKSKGARGASER